MSRTFSIALVAAALLGCPGPTPTIPDAALDASSLADGGPRLDAFETRALTPADREALRMELTQYFDARFDGTTEDTTNMVRRLATFSLTPAQVEELIREGRPDLPAVTPQPLGRTTMVDVSCTDVDYSSVYYIRPPFSYDRTRPTGIVLIGHGGNSSMTQAQARSTAQSYLSAYSALAADPGYILVAPATERGWSPIGESLLLASLWQVAREYNIDPDRVYVTGQSMGGHLAWRVAMKMADRWAAVSPQSGGYNYVDDPMQGDRIWATFGVPGYATWGMTEPYMLAETNRILFAWLGEHNYPWIGVEKNGGHEIYGDEMGNIGRFFAEHPRDMYRSRVFHRAAGTMRFTSTWTAPGWPTHTIDAARSYRWNQRNWIEMTPRGSDYTGWVEVYGEVVPGNEIRLTSSELRGVRIHVHPEMGIDMSRPVRIVWNGSEVWNARIEPRIDRMLETVREWNDRGRIFHGSVDLTTTSDMTVPVPDYPATE